MRYVQVVRSSAKREGADAAKRKRAMLVRYSDAGIACVGLRKRDIEAIYVSVEWPRMPAMGKEREKMTESERKTLVEFLGWKRTKWPHRYITQDERPIFNFRPDKVRDDDALLVEEVVRRGNDCEGLFAKRIYEEIRESDIYRRTSWNVIEGLLLTPEQITRAVLNTIKDMEETR